MLESLKNKANSLRSNISSGFSSSTRFISQKAWPAIKHGMKSYVAPGFFSFGGAIAVVGKSLYWLRKFLKYVTGVERHPLFFRLGLAVITFNIITYFASRAPAILKYFLRKKKNKNITIPAEKCLSCITLPENNMSRSAISFYFTIMGVCILYAFYNSLKANLFGYEVADFIATDALEYNIHDEEWKENLVTAFGLYVAFSNLISYFSFYLNKVDENARALSKNRIACNKYIAWTALIATLGSICTSYLEYSSAHGALNKIPRVKVPSSPKMILSLIGAASGTVSFLMANISSVYKILSGAINKLRYTNTPKWEKPAKIIVYPNMVGDAGTALISNFTGFILTSEELMNLDPRSIPLIVAATVFASSTACVTFFLSQLGFKEALNDHKKKSQTPYREIPSREINTIADDIMPRRNTTSVLFPSAATPILLHDSPLEIKIVNSI